MHKFVYLKTELTVKEQKIPRFSVGLAQEEIKERFEVQFVYKDIKALVSETYIEFFDPFKTGDLFEHKVCNVCHRYLSTNRFSRNQNGVGNRIIRRPSCDECRKIIDGISLKSSEKKKWSSSRPHLTIFKCPICYKTTIPGLTSKVVLDHDHKTGSARGWICDSCNTGIGRFKDEIELLKSAIKFLETN